MPKLYYIRKSFWFLPSFYSLIGIVLAIVSISIERYMVTWSNVSWIPDMILVDIDHGRSILAALVTAILTMTTITFSTVLVVLTTYSSQFSPRTLQNFIMEQKTQRVLGVFTGTFIYILLMFLFLKNLSETIVLISPAIAVFFTIVSLGFFVSYIHYVSTSVQVSNLIDQITKRTKSAIQKAFPNAKTHHLSQPTEAPWLSWESEEIKHLTPEHVVAHKTGYIQYIDTEGLRRYATQKDIIFRVERYVGEFIIEGSALFSYWGLLETTPNVTEQEVLTYITIGVERTTNQDVNFGIQKLVEIALRALSPGINDPNTAVVCVNELANILTLLGERQIPSPYYYDKASNLRIIMHHQDFSTYLYTCFFQIKQYGRGDLSVMSSVLEALNMVAENNDQEIKDEVWEFSKYIVSGIPVDKLHTLDKKFMNEKLMTLAVHCNHPKDFCPLS
ncbi:DUF2254 domain-containing protein [Caldalkalibacillus salinus]|uniref:DUF2254 domain-containing protein n=1 Tax=Caldalkalibacillus salinus TaxID=2803787 RepID=UPI0019242E1C|nr:DUF2254 domain-containing protein [Caldalkalibacillus salinus]